MQLGSDKGGKASPHLCNTTDGREQREKDQGESATYKKGEREILKKNTVIPRTPSRTRGKRVVDEKVRKKSRFTA